MPNASCAGGSGDDTSYSACITSYDYDAPISEAGDYGQPGIGGPNKFEVRLSAHLSLSTVVQRRHGLLCIFPGLSPDVDLFERQTILYFFTFLGCSESQMGYAKYQRLRHAIQRTHGGDPLTGGAAA